MASLSRRHFDEIAEALRESRPGFRDGRDHDRLVREVARALSGTNANFDRGRFLHAAGSSERG